MTPAELRDTIPVLSDLVYLNWGWAGPSPAAVLRATQEALRLEVARGPATPETLPSLEAQFDRARRELAALLGASSETIALTGNATSGLCLVAAGLDWRPGDEVVISDQEHPSNALPWYHLVARSGVLVREVPVREDVPWMLEEYARAITARTRVVAVSHVQWSTGQVMPLTELGRMAHARGGWLVVDAAQSAGQLPVAVDELGVDCCSAPGQKWLLGPSGTGAAYFSPALTEALAPSHVGWASVRDYRPGGQFELWHDARRFETATASAALYAGFAEALALAREVGAEAVRRRIQQLVGLLREELTEVGGLRLLSPENGDLRTGLLAVQIPGLDPERAVRRLFHQAGIVARSIPPLQAVRFCIHAYNTEDEMERVAAALAGICRG